MCGVCLRHIEPFVHNRHRRAGGAVEAVKGEFNVYGRCKSMPAFARSIPVRIADLDTVNGLLTTTRAIRRRLDLGQPVEPAVVLDAIRIATQAPSGGNKQTWHWIIITERHVKVQLAEEYRRGLELVKRQPGRPTTAVSAAVERLRSSSDYLAEHLEDVPILVLPCTRKADGVAGWGPSIYPAVWSFQLALRSRGVGSCLTTAHLPRSEEVAELLGIPKDVVQSCLLPVAYIKGETLHPGPRRPVEEVVSWNGWTDGGQGASE